MCKPSSLLSLKRRELNYFLPQSDPNSMEYLFPEYREVFMDYLMHEISLVMHEAEKAGIDL